MVGGGVNSHPMRLRGWLFVLRFCEALSEFRSECCFLFNCGAYLSYNPSDSAFFFEVFICAAEDAPPH